MKRGREEKAKAIPNPTKEEGEWQTGDERVKEKGLEKCYIESKSDGRRQEKMN